MLKRIVTPDKEIQFVQDNVDSALQLLDAQPFIGGNLLTGVSLFSASPTQVPHKLNHTPSVFVIAGLNANAVIWQVSADARFLTLATTADCIVSLWVH